MRSQHQLGVRHKDAYSWVLWQLRLLLRYWSRLSFYSVQVAIFTSFHLAHLKGRICLFVVNTFVCTVTRQIFLWFHALVLYILLKCFNSSFSQCRKIGFKFPNSINSSIFTCTFPNGVPSLFGQLLILWLPFHRFRRSNVASYDLHVYCTKVRSCSCLQRFYCVRN